MDFKFLHAADLHLDSPMRGLARYEGAPVQSLREATRQALKNLVRLAVEEEVDFVLLAGDLYDGDWKDFNTGLFLVQRLRELEKAGIPVYAIKGNHDAESRLTRKLTLPQNTTMFSHTKPESARLESLKVALHGQSFAKAAVEEDLAAQYPDPLEGYFNIGLLHTSADGRAGHAPYAPCTVESLKSKGYDYWALGHVHQREVLCQDPWVVFPGNIQGRHARETGDKGATLVTVEDHRVTAAEHRSLDVARWAHLRLDVEDCQTPLEVVSLVDQSLQTLREDNGDRLLAVRVELQGRSPAHYALHTDPEKWANELRAVAGDDVWLEKIKFHTRSVVSPQKLAERDDAFALLMNSIEQIENDDAALEQLGKSLFAELEQKLPVEIRQGEDGLRPTDPTLLRTLLPDVRHLLASRLLENSEGER